VPSIDVVIPCYNEEHVLAGSVETLRAFLKDSLPYQWRILIADNASTDRTLDVAKQLADQHPGEVAWLHLPQKGRGRALRRAWLDCTADATSYMDVDLSTDLRHFPELAKAVLEDGYDLAIGSRLAKGAEVTRSLKREITSRGFVFLIRSLFFSGLTDTQCGFKAITRQAAHRLVPLIENEEWFFDTELLLLAEKGGYRIKQIPVHWVEDPDTRVNIRKTVAEDLQGLVRMRFRRIPKKPATPPSGS